MTSPTTRFYGKLVYVRFKDFTLFMDDLEVWFHGREIERRRTDNSAIEKFIEEARETLRLKEIGHYPILRYSLTPSTAPLTEFFPPPSPVRRQESHRRLHNRSRRPLRSRPGFR